MNKEIEEILKFLKEPLTKEKTHKAIDKKDTKLLLSYIEQLEKENKILRENAEHNDKVVDKVNWKINILKNNRDKAIEYIHNYFVLGASSEYVNKLENILKDDSDE